MRGDNPVLGTVKGQKRGPDGEYIGSWNSNPILDTSIYEVQYDDGSIECYLANQSAEEIYQRIDDDGYLVDEIKDIADHKKNASAIAGDDSFVEVLKRKDRILKMLQKRTVRRKNEKFGIEVPKPMDVKRALEIDRETGTDHWAKAIKKEVATVFPALRVLEDGESLPVGSQLVDLMMIFDVKMDLTRKARLVARGDQVETPSNLTYASVVSRDSI
jgi:hypothetical protein